MHRTFSAAVCTLALVTSVHVVGQQPVASPPAAADAPLDWSVRIFPGTRSDAFAGVEGHALNAANGSLANSLVRLRDARMGRIISMQVTDKAGSFTFPGVDPGNYVVELVSAVRTALAATPLISLNAGETAKVLVKLPSGPSMLATLLGQRRGSADSGGATELIPAITEQLPQSVIQAIPAVTPIGDPVSER